MGRSLSKTEREQIDAEIIKGELGTLELMTKYKVTDSTIYNYRRRLGIIKPREIIFPVRKNPITINSVENKPLEQENDDYDLEIIKGETMGNENTEPSRADLGIENKPIDSEKVYTLDPKKDYCGDCYAKSRVVEILSTENNCPVCGAVLERE